MPFPQFEIEFTKDGQLFNNAQEDEILKNAPTLTDVFIISHGWNNNKVEATKLYDDFFANLSKVLSNDLVKGLEERKFGVIRIFWPSKKFADADLVPAGGAASLTPEVSNKALISLLEKMKPNPARLGGQESDPLREENLRKAQDLVPQLETDTQARRDFLFRLRTILDPSDRHADDGSVEFFAVEPEKLFEQLKGPVNAPLGSTAHGATSLSRSGGAAAVGDILTGFVAAAQRIANYTTYYEMKQRAGTVGSTGVFQLMRRLRERNSTLRLHLIGHSFGGRLVIAAAHALPSGTPAVSISLLQAAFSHNGLSDSFDDNNTAGAFRALLAEKRASGPIIITYTKNDQAVGIAYPLASRFARDQAAAMGDENDPYGGMGRNGAQHTPEVSSMVSVLQQVGGQYEFTAGSIYNLKADDLIKDHGDVTGPQVAYAVLNAAKSV